MWCESGKRDCELLDEVRQVKEEALLLLATTDGEGQLDATSSVNEEREAVVENLENFCSSDLNDCGLIRWAIRNIILINSEEILKKGK